jgi:hypothetical protein
MAYGYIGKDSDVTGRKWKETGLYWKRMGRHHFDQEGNVLNVDEYHLRKISINFMFVK